MRKVESDEPPEGGEKYVGYRRDRGRVRWWVSEDPSDVFEVIEEKEFLRRLDEAHAAGTRVVDLDLFEGD